MRSVRCKWVLMCGLAALAGSGCAFSDQRVALWYSPRVQGVDGGGTVYIAQPAEPAERKDPQSRYFIGTVRNGYGLQTAKAYTDDSAGKWILGALRLELANAGFRSQVSDALPASCSRGIEVEIKRIWVDEERAELGSVAEVSFDLRLIKGGQKVKETSVTGTHKGFGMPRSVSLTPDCVAIMKEDALTGALQSCMRQALPLIAETFGENQP